MFLRRCDALCQFLGIASIAVRHGLQILPLTAVWDLTIVSCMAVIALAVLLRYQWSLAKPSFFRRHITTVLASILWAVCCAVSLMIVPFITQEADSFWDSASWRAVVLISELVLFAYASTGTVRGLRKIAANGVNPAGLLVGSFGVLITLGTLTLLLPACTAPGQQTSLTTALFTATSACCVTGLVVVDTGVHWTRAGQIVILSLFQVGGLGIMTFGAFFAAVAGRNVALSEAATLRDLLGSEGLHDVRRIVFSILGFTLIAETIGAILLMPLWADLPFGERAFQAWFHAVSAFCNAGFALTPNSFVGMGHRWQIWGVVPGLIILGGLGFVALNNSLTVVLTDARRILGRWRNYHVPQRVRLSLTTRIVGSSTVLLLIAGTVFIFLLEYRGTGISLADAWFQSVTFRTAGFNTVELSELKTATLLVAVLLMVVGASPGSTGGGVKTSVFGVAVISLLSVLRGRDRVEAWGRTIPAVTVNRALTILLVYTLTVMIVTLFLVILEDRPEAFLAHLFEATSAVGTVGVSAGVELEPGEVISTTKSLTTGSRYIIILAMFLGRVGPLTLLLALAGEPPAVRFEYPPEKVTLG